MKFKESNKQKYYMRNVYINQIMKPEIQNNLNYAYFENSASIPNYLNNPNIDINQDNIFFNNNPLQNIYQNYYPNPASPKKHKKTNLSQKRNTKNEIYFNNPFIEMNDASQFMRNMNKNNWNPGNHFNERSVSENKINNFNQTQSFFKKKDRNIDTISNLKINPSNKTSQNIKNIIKRKNDINSIYYFDAKQNNNVLKHSNNENVSRNTNNNSSLKNGINTKMSFYDKKNKSKTKNNEIGKNTYFSEMHKNKVNKINTIVNVNDACVTSPNCNNSNITKIKKDSKENKNLKYSNNISRKNNQINSYKNVVQHKNNCYKSMDMKAFGNTINFNNYMNKYNSPQRINDENKNMDNVSSVNSPSMPSYSTVNEDNSINSKNYVWVKKNINNNKFSNNKDNNYLYNYYKKPNINQENSIQENLINFANNITNIDSLLYDTEVIFPNKINKNFRGYEEQLFEQSASLIQSTFRSYFAKKRRKFFSNYKYYYHKAIELIELFLNYSFSKHINIISEKRKFFKYLKSLKKSRNTKYENGKYNSNKISQKPKSYKNFKMINSPFSPVIRNGKIVSKFYHDLFLHKEIGERFNIITENNKEKDIEKRLKEKIDIISIKVNKLTKENNILKDMNQKNVVNERKYREISKENKKKDDIISIITNDNKTLAKKLKIIQDKFNKLQIQNQDYINYNSVIQKYEKNNDIDLFEEYRNLFLSFIIHKMNEKYNLSILRQYLYKWQKISFSFKKYQAINHISISQTLKNSINNKRNKEKYISYIKLMKYHYKNMLHEKDFEMKNNLIKYKLLNIFKNKERAYKYNLKFYFYQFYYKGIMTYKEQTKCRNIIEIRKENYPTIKKLVDAIRDKKNKNNKNILKEYFLKWHLYTKVISLKALINDKRRKKRQKQKMKKKNENEANNKYLANNNILHFGKSNIYILNKEKEKDLLISLDEKNQKYLSQNQNTNDNKINNVIQATNKLGEIFYKAAAKHKLLEDKNSDLNINKEENKENDDKNKNNNNDVEEEEDSGESFGL